MVVVQAELQCFKSGHGTRNKTNIDGTRCNKDTMVHYLKTIGALQSFKGYFKFT